jgi:uncharacterized protein YjdB
VSAYDGHTEVKTAITYKTSNVKALQVSSAGKARAGRVTRKTKVKVTAMSKSRRHKTFTVYVMPSSVKLRNVSFSGVPSSMKKGAYRQVRLKLTPSNATNPKPKFKSSNPKVISVDGEGMLYAKKKGTAKITVKIGGKHATKTIKVK